MERFLSDVASIYKSLNIDFDPAWFPVFHLLSDKKRMAVTELASLLEISHSAVSQLVKHLEKKDLLLCSRDDNDGRRRLITLSPAGFRLLAEVQPVWNVIDETLSALFAEQDGSGGFLEALSQLEDALGDESLFERFDRQLREGQEIAGITIRHDDEV